MAPADLSRLSPREAAFLRAYFGGKTETDAYLEVRPAVTRDSANSLGPKLLKRIRKKVDWPKLLEAADLGETRLLRELNKRLSATESLAFEGHVVGHVDDNRTRMEGTKLLAKILGKEKVDVTVTAPPELVIRFEPPKPPADKGSA